MKHANVRILTGLLCQLNGETMPFNAIKAANNAGRGHKIATAPLLNPRNSVTEEFTNSFRGSNRAGGKYFSAQNSKGQT